MIIISAYKLDASDEHLKPAVILEKPVEVAEAPKAPEPKVEAPKAPEPKAAAKPVAAKPAPAPDKKTKEAARKAYGEGEKAFAAGDFSAAYTGYSKANELIPSAHAAYWAAKSLDQGGKSQDAIKGYESLPVVIPRRNP